MQLKMPENGLTMHGTTLVNGGKMHGTMPKNGLSVQVKISAVGSKMQATKSLTGQKKTELSLSLRELGNSLKLLVISLKIGLMMLASPRHLKMPENGLKEPGMIFVLVYGKLTIGSRMQLRMLAMQSMMHCNGQETKVTGKLPVRLSWAH